MKKLFTPFLLMAVCSTTVIAQQKIKIEPSGNIITKDVSVQQFDAIKAEGIYELILSQGIKNVINS